MVSEILCHLNIQQKNSNRPICVILLSNIPFGLKGPKVIRETNTKKEYKQKNFF